MKIDTICKWLKELTSFRRFKILVLVLCSLVLYTGTSFCQSPVSPGYQAAYNYKSTSAYQYRANDCFVNLQGIANGEPESGYPFWYFSNIRLLLISEEPLTYRKTPALFRVSYSTHLNSGVTCSPKNVIELAGTYCDHIGDIDYFRNELITGQTGYVIGGFDNCDNGRAYIAFFKEEDLGLPGENIYAHAYIDIKDHQGAQALWVTTTEDGAIYCGSGKFVPKHVFYKYPASLWIQITLGGEVEVDNNQVIPIELYYPDGTPFVEDHWQGADFSSDGQYFYFSQGYMGYGYIHSFKVNSFITTAPQWFRERVSKKDEMPFRFESTGVWHEPEGISYFDMNSVVSYHPDMPKSELHAVVWDNLTGGSYIKHYTSIIDISNSESVADIFYNKWGEGAWDGSILRIESGSYNEQSILQGRKVKVVTNGSPVIIGE